MAGPPIDFPSSPATGDRFTAGNITWTWDGIKWTLSGSGTISLGDTPPAAPLDGAQWWDTVSGQLFIWYIDNDGGQWVAASNTMSSGPPGPEGPQGPIGGNFPDAPEDGSAYLRADGGWSSGGEVTGSLAVGIPIPTSPPLVYDQAFIQDLTIPGGNAVRLNCYVTPEGPSNIYYSDGSAGIIFTDGVGMQFNVGEAGLAGEPVPGFGVATLDPAGNLNVGGIFAGVGVQTSGLASGQSVIAVGGSIPQSYGGAFWFHATADNPDAFVTFLVDGSFGTNFGLNANGHFYQGGWSDGAVYTQFWTSADFANPGCDYRIKDDVDPMASTWDQVKELNPICYRQKAFSKPNAPKGARPLLEADDRHHCGFIAHELQETLGEAAATGVKDDPDLLQAPNLMMVVATLTRALQEAMERIEALEARG